MKEAILEGFRLSPLQRRLWTLDEEIGFQPRVCCVVELQGRLELNRLRSALGDLTARHEVLHTCYRALPAARFPLQCLEPPAGAPSLEMSQDAPSSAGEAAGAAFRWARRLTFEPGGYPLRSRLFPLTGGGHLLLLTLPALAGDLVGLRNLVAELARLYAGDAAIGDAAIEEPEIIQYCDVAEGLNEMLESEETAEGRVFWQRQPWPERLGARLPLERSAPEPAPRELRRLAVPAASAPLAAAARALDLPASTVALAAWTALLDRSGDGLEPVVGVTFDGRSYEGLDRALGLFAKVLPVAPEIAAGTPFQAFAGGLEETLDELHDWQEFFAWEDGEAPAGGWFAYQFEHRDPPPYHRAGELRLVVRAEEAEIEPFVVKLLSTAGDAGGDPALELAHDPRVLAETDAACLAERLATLLADAAEHPDARLDELRLLGARERRRLLVELNRTAVEAPAAPTLHRPFFDRARATPDSIAVVDGERTVSYGRLAAEAERLAGRLRALGAGPERRVALCAEPTAERVVGMLGILVAGAAYLPLDPGHPAERWQLILAEAGAVAMVVEPALADRLTDRLADAGDLPVVRLELGGEVAAEPPEIPVDPRQAAYVIYTSGSTGRPKGVLNSHGAIANRVRWAQRTRPLATGDRLLQKTPVVFDASIWEIFLPLWSGAELVMAGAGGSADPTRMARRIRRHRVTVLQLVPSLVGPFLDRLEGAGSGSLRLLFCGGEVLSRDLEERCAERLPATELHNLYGPTEVSIDAASWPCRRDDDRPTIPIGRPLDNVRLYLLTAGGKPAATGVPGEIHVAGIGLARGYLRRPGLTAERFVPDPFAAETGGRLYRTGDLGRWRSDGAVEFLGRLDHQVKVSGVRIEPGEIEAALRAHPGVAEAAVGLLPHPRAGSGAQGDVPRLAAWVVPRPVAGGTLEPLPGSLAVSWRSAVVSAAELRSHLERRLPPTLVPSALVAIIELPRTAGGKLDRRSLPAPDGAPREEKRPQPPRSPTEEIVAEIWADALGVERPGVDQSFFALGGHSLLALQIVGRLGGIFSLELRARDLFEAATITELAAVIDARLAGSETALPPLEPRPETTPPPLSFAQRRLWFLQRLAPENSSYNLPLAVRLTGRLDLAALGAGLQRVVDRHQALRTDFPSDDGTPYQRIAAELAVPLPRVDLDALPAERREEAGRRAVRRLNGEPFDLARGPLLRAAAVRLDERRHLLLVTVHHAVGDGWSTGILVRELAELYSAVIEDRRPSLPRLPIQYADYASWQYRWLRGEVLERQLDHWRRQLGDEGPLLELSTDRPRPAALSTRGDRHRFRLPAALVGELRALGNERGATLFMTLLGAFAALLHRDSRQADLRIGTPIANRRRPEVENLIGLFLNTLVLRLEVADDPSFEELLTRSREVALTAYGHRDLPFERLVEELATSRDLGRTPLFQVLLVLQNTPLEPVSLPGLELEPYRFPTGHAKFDLTLDLWEVEGGLVGDLEYRTELFDFTTVARLARRFEVLLGGVVAAPGARLSELPLLPPSESHQLLAEWNDHRRPLPPEDTLHRQLAERACHQPGATALVHRGRRLSYRRLERRASALAHRLVELGVGPERLVAIALEPSFDLAVAIFGVLAAGGAYLPLDPSHPRERLAFVLADAGVELLLTHSALTPGLPRPDGRRVLELDREPALDDPREDRSPPGAADPEQLAYLIYTSGSTGRPKGVAVTHRNVVNFFAGMDERLGAEPGVWLAVTTISFDISVLELLFTLTRGFEVVLPGSSIEVLELSAPEAAAPARAVDFSLFYFANDDRGPSEDPYRLLLEGARFADRHGFQAVWTPERHFHRFGGLYPNPAVTSAAVAAVTERVAIRAGSVVLPLHHPIRLAEEWSVIDNLSRGRVGISFASGWHANDFVLAPAAFGRKKELMFEGIEQVRALWRGEAIRARDGAGEEIEVRIHPRPVQEELPVWVTAAGNPETFRAAGEIGAGLLTHLLGQSVEELGDKIRSYRRAWRRSGRPGDGHVTLMLHTFVGERLDQVREVVRGPFQDYLRSSVALLRALARSVGRDIDSDAFDDRDVQALLDHSFDRYFETSGLMGTVESCRPMVERLRAIEVDEIGCLIDFGIATDTVLGSLEQLARLRDESRPPARAPDGAEAPSLPALIAEHGVTHLQCTPSLGRLLAGSEPVRGALAGLHRLMLGGEALPASLADELGRLVAGEVHNMYGPTETTVWSATWRLEPGAGPVPIGRPIANTVLRVVDRRLRPTPLGVAGELLIGGTGVTRGYLGRPALTAERFVPDPRSGDPFAADGEGGGRLYRTGDLVRHLPGGELTYLGRLDHQVKVRGFRIELGEIEDVLRRHPAVDEAAVVARREGADTRLAAFWTPSPEAAARPPVELPEGRGLFRLPNGLEVVPINELQAHQAYREIFENEIYLRHGITLEDGDRIFDVGANSGFFTLFVHRRCRPAKVYAFEPVPPTFETLKANAELHGLEVELFDFGLSRSPEEAELTFYPAMPGLSGRYSESERDLRATRSIMLAGLRENQELGRVVDEAEIDELLAAQFRSERYRCRLRPLSDVLDELAVESIDLLKVDVERAEVDVLAGIRDEHWARIHQIVLEIDTRKNLREIERILSRHGYRYRVEEFVMVEGQGDEPGVHVFMLYARQPGWRRPPRPAVEPAASGAREPSVAELRQHLRRSLPDYMLPAHIVRRHSLPLTANAKVDRKALMELDPGSAGAAPAADRRFRAPRSQTEVTLAQIWSELLRVDRVGIDDNFFELGGDSILGIQVIDRARRAGLQLSPRQIFQHQTVAELARHATAGGADDGEQEAVVGPVPLTPIQRWFFDLGLPRPEHWNQSQLLAVRQPLEPALLARAMDRLSEHHDALRMRFEPADKNAGDAGWRQRNAPPAEPEVPLWIDLSSLPDERRSATLELAAAAVQGSLDLTRGPLFRAAYFDRGEGRDDRLLIAVHHLVVDGVSWRILLEDLHTAYRQLAAGEAVRLPAKTTSFRSWARRLVTEARSEAVWKELEGWLDRPWSRVTRLPRDHRHAGGGTEASAATVRVALEPEETRQLLREVPAAYGTRIDEALLTALLQAFAGWTGQRHLLVDLEGHGRDAAELDTSRTVGWLTVLYPAVLELAGGSVGEHLMAVKEQLRQLPGNGLSWGLLRYLAPDDAAERLAALPRAEVIFNYLGQLDPREDGDRPPFEVVDEPAGPPHHPAGERSHALVINASVVGGRLRATFGYSRRLHRRRTLDRLAGDFLAALRELIAHCRSGEAGAFTPSDFPDADLDQRQLDDLLGEVGEAWDQE